MDNKRFYSTHTFMFPFIFDKKVEEVNDVLIKEGWEYKPFSLISHKNEKEKISHENYNEYIYFYEHVRKIFYSRSSMDDPKNATFYFEIPEQKGTFSFTIPIKDDDQKIVETKTYTLDIVGVSLRTFSTQVGILSIELVNKEYAAIDDILCINDFGRRVYPQFLSSPDNENGVLHDVKGNLLPDTVKIKLGHLQVTEDFQYYAGATNIEKDVTHLPNYIHQLLGETFVSLDTKDKSGTIHIEPIIDDRMFVISLALNDAISKELGVYNPKNDQYAYEESELWYKYLFVDSSYKTCQSIHMTRKLIAESTYDRWVEWGTLFGVTRYSFVALTGSQFGRENLEPHMRTLYYQMFTLLLAYRASLLQFSNRVASLDIRKETLDQLQIKVEEIYGDYIHFQNKLLFRELTAQEQGIEIYNKAYEVLGIDKQVKDLDSEIAELHNYIQIQQSERENQKLNKLNLLAGWLLPASVVSGIAGMNVLPASCSGNRWCLGATVILIVGFTYYITKIIQKEEKE